MTVPKNPVWNAARLAVGVAATVLLYACSGPAPAAMLADQPGLLRTLTGHTFWVLAVAWSPDSRFIASGGNDHTARIWDAASGQLLTTLDFRGDVSSLAWSPSNTYLATGSTDPNSQVRIWGVGSWKPVLTWNPPTNRVNSLSWSPDGTRLAVGTDWIGDPSGQTTSGDSSLEIYEVSSGRQVAVLTNPTKVYSVTWSPTASQIAFSDLLWRKYPAPPAGRLLVWNLSSGAGPSTAQNTLVLTDPMTDAASIGWSPNGKLLATSGLDNNVQIWDVTSRHKIATFTGPTQNITHVAWSPDGKYLAASSTDRTVRVWDVASGQNTATFPHADFVSSVAWSPDSKLLATACSDHNVYIWEVK